MHTEIDLEIQFPARLSREPADQFVSEVQHAKLRLAEEEAPICGAGGGPAWLLPTAVVAYVFRPYFKAFLTEAGRSHYQLLSRALARLAQSYLRKSAITLESYSDPSEVPLSSEGISLEFSVVAKTSDDKEIKLLLNPRSSDEQIELIVSKFLAVVERYYLSGELDEIGGIESVSPDEFVIAVKYDVESSSFEVLKRSDTHE